jgi:hypothetical protein
MSQIAHLTREPRFKTRTLADRAHTMGQGSLIQECAPARDAKIINKVNVGLITEQIKQRRKSMLLKSRFPRQTFILPFVSERFTCLTLPWAMSSVWPDSSLSWRWSSIRGATPWKSHRTDSHDYAVVFKSSGDLVGRKGGGWQDHAKPYWYMVRSLSMPRAPEAAISRSVILS